jgi:CheY-like chemotaxis protein
MSSSLDLRLYRPSALIAFDLVKHSLKGKAAVHAIQDAMKETLEKATKALGIEDIRFNYTGDGYICVLAGDSSARALDFLAYVVPALKALLAGEGQEIRIGVDFGLIHFSKNSLTGKSEYFGNPTIQAARLESVAQPGQILCTETVHQMFVQNYPEMFSDSPTTVTTKDRTIRAYEIFAVDLQSQVREYLSRYFFGPVATAFTPSQGRDQILVVDDEEAIRECLNTMLALTCPGFRVTTAANGKEALDLFGPAQFAAVFADMVMPQMDGIELTRRIASLDVHVPVVMISAVHDDDVAKSFLASGGAFILLKPFEKEEMFEVLAMSISGQSSHAIRNGLALLSDDLGSFLFDLHLAVRKFRLILQASNRINDRAAALLRHQAKQAVNVFLSGLGLGTDVKGMLTHLYAQLACIQRLSSVVRRLKMPALGKYLSDLISDFETLNPRIKFSFECFPDLGVLDSVPEGGLLALVLFELVDNAISALAGRGKINTRICFLRASGALQLTIHDSGPGVRPDLVPNMFREGISTKGPSRGLGLSLVRGAVHTLGGTIDYTYEAGAKFCLVIPSAQGGTTER